MTHRRRVMLRVAIVALLATRAHVAGSTPDLVRQVMAAAIAQTGQRVRYDGAFRRIPYPGGDVPQEIGVCTDVVIRAFRAAGIDLQQRIHEDMRRAAHRAGRRQAVPGRRNAADRPQHREGA